MSRTPLVTSFHYAERKQYTSLPPLWYTTEALDRDPACFREISAARTQLRFNDELTIIAWPAKHFSLLPHHCYIMETVAEASAHSTDAMDDMEWHTKIMRGRDKCLTLPEEGPMLALASPKSIETANRFQDLQHVKDGGTELQNNKMTGTQTVSCPKKRLRIPTIILKNMSTHSDLVELLKAHFASTFTFKP
ncbi:hypothetical protein NDU88_004056 [Pleurodeles waltl]|uniref:Uncharacterized protein n=1 Tax=Pleurodeles waltl TaxID=8319 RepID=A0AAV7PDX8_PLEWA|nr:hypothetical protein NDU88_004056 [Pleurodeles waltl]